MKLYDSRRAPNPRRVRWVMAEKAITDIEIVDIDIFKGEHRTPSFIKRAGLPQIPTLEFDDGTAITESVVICRYLESLYPEPNLFGLTAREAAEIEMWSRRTEMMLATPLMLAVRHGHPALAALEAQAPAVAETNLAGATRALKILDRALSERDFIAGDRITMADILAYTAMDFARMIKFQVPEERAAVNAWRARMAARPAAAAGT